jgi:hypothetical protein
VLGDNFLTVEREFVMKGDTTFSLMIKSFEINKPLVFESLEFRANSAKLSATLKPQLDYIVRFLQNYPMFKLVVEGHTDADGAAATNQTLSEDRARAIRDYLTLKGKFDPDRISSRGWGETQPIVPNDTEDNKRKNRRVEFKLVLDAEYDGDMFLPSEKELYFDKALDSKPDPEHDKEFDWGEEEAKAWEEELEGDEDLDLDKELEEDILRKAGEEEPVEEEEEETEEEGGGGRS